MQLIPNHELHILFFSGKCPSCDESIAEDSMEIIKPTKTINFSRCKLCLSAFKVLRRKMKHSLDKYMYEVTYDDGGTSYAVKCYQISHRTFLRNSYKFNINQSYSDFFIPKDEFLIDT